MTLTADMARAGLRPFAERAAQPNGITADEARELLEESEAMTSMLERLRKRIDGMISQGVEGQTLAAALEDQIELLDSSAKAFGEVRAKAAAMALDAALWAKLDAASATIRGMRGAAAKLLAWLNAPQPAVDPAAFPTTRGDRDAEGFIGLDEFAARLRARRGG